MYTHIQVLKQVKIPLCVFFMNVLYILFRKFTFKGVSVPLKIPSTHMALNITFGYLLYCVPASLNFKHVNSIKEMLPYFHASGHLPYAKSAHLYLQDMLKLEEVMEPSVYQRFKEDFH